jgi:hypothetical protein
LIDVARAGAVAALLYNVADRDLPPGGFGAGSATLPALMVINSDGIAIKKQLAANPSLSVTLNLQVSVIPFTENGVTSFSVKANADLSIAEPGRVGTDIYTPLKLRTSGGELTIRGLSGRTDGTSYRPRWWRAWRRW